MNQDHNYLGFKINNNPDIWVSTAKGIYEEFKMITNSSSNTISIRNKDGHYLEFKKTNNTSKVSVSTTAGDYAKFTYVGC